MNIAINIEGVSKSFGTKTNQKMVINLLTLSVEQGEVFGFLGPNGAGKSTTIKLLLNFLQPDKGSLTIMGCKVGQEEFRHKIGYLPEFPFFYDHLTATETLSLSGRLSGMRKSAIQQRIPQLLGQMDLLAASDQRVGRFSKGMRQRLGVANALIHDPELLIFDEPMSGLDPLGRYQIKELITELQGQGKTIFFSSHILSDIEALCDSIAIINRGELLYSGALRDFLVTDEKLEERFVTIVQEANNVSPT